MPLSTARRLSRPITYALTTSSPILLPPFASRRRAAQADDARRHRAARDQPHGARVSGPGPLLRSRSLRAAEHPRPVFVTCNLRVLEGDFLADESTRSEGSGRECRSL